ncbi:MAG: dTDP-glucose 4,6-dehydratase [Desulfobacteraceae bacterium]|jgi:dTDP-glucose 4,6-dehydratase|nr:dTDP-glucose 4,6-dehydratase [Desulfobacteraceae bacterium]
MKNLLVTGGCGFIGSVFIRYLLLDSDYDGRIINIDKLTYAGNPDNLADVEKSNPERYIFLKADICDPEAMAHAFNTYEVDAVCNFAAESHVDRSIVAPDAFIRTNIEGTFNLLEVSRQKADRLVLFHHVSTDEVYGSLGSDGFFTEKTPYKPNSPYSASKAASDHLVRAYNKTYALPATISNCSNNYGPYQFPEKLIPLMILNAIEDRPLPVYGDGSNVRDWLFVKDHCRAVWEIMKRGTRGQTYNIGGRCELANLDIVAMVCDLLDEMVPKADGRSRRDLITFVKDRPGHDLRYAIDCSKLEKELGWIPVESLETGLRKTIQWYLDNSHWVQRVKSGEYLNWMREHYGNDE